jgi:hypothetical protein
VEDKKTTTTAGGTQDMINIFENNNTDFLHSMSDITFILSLIPLVIFVWLAVRSKSIKTFQFQISIFIAVYILGEIIENNSIIIIFSVLPPDIGSQIHIGSAIFFTIMIWFRFYYAEKSGKNMVESSIGNGNSSDSSMSSTNK